MRCGQPTPARTVPGSAAGIVSLANSPTGEGPRRVTRSTDQGDLRCADTDSPPLFWRPHSRLPSPPAAHRLPRRRRRPRLRRRQPRSSDRSGRAGGEEEHRRSSHRAPRSLDARRPRQEGRSRVSVEGQGPLTVFAPTNAAFAKLAKSDPALFAKVSKDKALLTSVLKYHVVAGAYPASVVVTKKTLTSLDGKTTDDQCQERRGVRGHGRGDQDEHPREQRRRPRGQRSARPPGRLSS